MVLLAVNYNIACQLRIIHFLFTDTINTNVTHVVVDKRDTSRLDEINKLVEDVQGQMMDIHQIHVVDMKWVYDSIRAGEDLVEDSYIV